MLFSLTKKYFAQFFKTQSVVRILYLKSVFYTQSVVRKAHNFYQTLSNSQGQWFLSINFKSLNVFCLMKYQSNIFRPWFKSLIYYSFSKFRPRWWFCNFGANEVERKSFINACGPKEALGLFRAYGKHSCIRICRFGGHEQLMMSTHSARC